MENFYQAPVEEQIGRLRALALEALNHWGVEDCEPVLLKYRENAVFKVRAPSGQPAATELAPTIVGIASDAAERFLASPRGPA